MSGEQSARTRRAWWVWGAAAAIAVAVAIVVTVVVLKPEAESGGGRTRHLPVKSLGELTKAWEIPETVVSPVTVIARDVMVSVECRPLPATNARSWCELRGRDIGSGQQRWLSPERVSHTTVLESIGGAVVLHHALNNEGSASLILDPTTGGVFKRVPNTRLIAFSERTAVFADRGRRHHVAIDTASGKHVWNATDIGELNMTSFREHMPPGSAQIYDTDVPSRWIALPGDGRAQIMEIDTGIRASVLTKSRGASVSAVGDNILVDDLVAHTVEVVETQVPNRSLWKTRLIGNEFAAPCGGMVCVLNTQRPSGRLLDPVTGRVLAKHDGGLLFGQRVGGNVVVLECSGRANEENPCGIDEARWRLLSRGDGAELREGRGKPVFVGKPRPGSPDAVIAEAEPGTGIIHVTYVPADPAEVLRSATIAAEGLARVPIDPTGRLQAQYVPNLRCELAGPQLVCLPNYAGGKPTGWRGLV